MGIIDIIKIIVEYGIVPVVLAVSLYIVIKGFNSIKENNEKQAKINEDQNKTLTELFKTMVNVKCDTDHTHSHAEEEENRKINVLIGNHLQDLLLKVNANRVCCFLYHNGGYSINGRSF